MYIYTHIYLTESIFNSLSGSFICAIYFWFDISSDFTAKHQLSETPHAMSLMHHVMPHALMSTAAVSGQYSSATPTCALLE